MNLITYTFSGNQTEINKTLIQLQTFTVSLIHELDLLAPYLIFTKSNYNSDANYVYIEETKRYYFITNTHIASGNRITLNCSVDPFYTYRNELLECDVNVIRNEKIGINDFNDDKLPILPNDFTITALDFSSNIPIEQTKSGYIVGIL